ncbi:MAG: hypothetical protein ABI120_12060 [Gemmatimonadaceae bacterium]
MQLVTRNSVTQEVLLEGGLSRDGALRPGKIGLLDYALGAARDPEIRAKMYGVPVGINYDRVLEDRTLLRELETKAERPVSSRGTQLHEVASYLLSNMGRLVTGRWERYDEMLARIGAIIPVTSVPLTCAAIQSFETEYIAWHQLLERMEAMRDVLIDLNGRVVRADRNIEETFDRAYRMLRLRRIVARAGDGYVVLPRGRPLVNYYANSIVHLLAPFAAGVRAWDALPAYDLHE